MLSPLLCRRTVSVGRLQDFCISFSLFRKYSHQEIADGVVERLQCIVSSVHGSMALYTLFQEIGRKRVNAALREVDVPFIQVGSNIWGNRQFQDLLLEGSKGENHSSNGTNAIIWKRWTHTLIWLCSNLPVIGLFTLFLDERFNLWLYSHRKVAWQKWKKHPSP